jgi:hypothetical protein
MKPKVSNSPTKTPSSIRTSHPTSTASSKLWGTRMR